MSRLRFSLRFFIFFLLFSFPLTIGASAAVLGIGAVNVDALNFREAPNTTAKVIRVVASGTRVVVLETLEGWYKVSLNGSSGYMAAGYLDTADKADIELAGVVTADVLNVRGAPSVDSLALTQLKKGDAVQIKGIDSGFYVTLVGETAAYLHSDYIELTSPAPSGLAAGSRAELIAFAKQFIGTPYRAGGASPSGFDCSGFVSYVFKNAGYSLPHGASKMMDSVSVVPRTELQPGDLVFFNDGSARRASHVGIYLGNNEFIHAVKPGYALTISTMASGYYAKTYCGAGRVFA